MLILSLSVFKIHKIAGNRVSKAPVSGGAADPLFDFKILPVIEVSSHRVANKMTTSYKQHPKQLRCRGPVSSFLDIFTCVSFSFLFTIRPSLT